MRVKNKTDIAQLVDIYGISQRCFAARFNVKYSTLTAYSAGTRETPFKLIVAIKKDWKNISTINIDKLIELRRSVQNGKL